MATQSISETSSSGYVLEHQVGFLLRQVGQRHGALFLDHFGDSLTPTQWASLVKLHERGPLSQNLLGRSTSMDIATIKGVIDRMTKRGLTKVRADEADGRLRLVELTAEGRKLVEALLPLAIRVTEATLAPLSRKERETLMKLLRKLR
jgi:DNA-binding MarR family transcriptional regulator